MASLEDLRRSFQELDGRGYKAYKRIAGHYRFAEGTLFIDHVQGDPFAAPSKMRLRVPRDIATLPADLYRNRVRRIALEDYLAR